MLLKKKIIISLLAVFIIFGTLGTLIIYKELKQLKARFSDRIARHQINETLNQIETASVSAVVIASIFSKLSDVLDAYKIAHSGNIENETDISCRQAKLFLRNALRMYNEGFEKNIEKNPPELHFYLPNGLNLLQMRLDGHTDQDGLWMDASDSLTSTQHTQTEVDKSDEYFRGVEIGKAGFVIRGLAPIKSAAGKQMGSVEFVVDMAEVLNAKDNLQIHDTALFMNAEFLSVAKRLNDSQKYPISDNRFVQVLDFYDMVYSKLSTPDLLEKGKSGLVTKTIENLCVAAYPIMDNQNRQIGVMVHGFDMTQETALIQTLGISLAGLLAAIMLATLMVSSVVLSRLVLSPVNQLTDVSYKISEGDLTQEIPPGKVDEIGVLFSSQNDMIKSFKVFYTEISSGIEMLSNRVNGITETTLKLAEDTSETSISIADISSSLEQFQQSVHMNGENIQKVAADTEEVSHIADSGSMAARNTISSINRIKDEIDYTADSLLKLNELNRNIGEIINVLTDIADQSVLLSVNAAIEASRAGEHGKGFVIVAQEIKSMANQSKKASRQMRQVLSDMETAVSEAVIATEKGTRAAEEETSLALQTNKTVDTLARHILKSVEVYSQIADSSQRQFAEIGQVSGVMINLEETVAKNVDAARQLKEFAITLKDLSASLKAMTGKFHI
ncbi:MAG: methyl-accepting chemotaxis protein [Desulfobacterales bacterium]